MQEAQCICARIPRLTSRLRFVVFRHAKERWRSTNTARIAALGLESVEIVDYGLAEAPPLDLSRVRPGDYLLFPGGTSAPPARDQGLVRILIPDGNWHQAGRLARRLRQQPGVSSLSMSGVERAKHTLRRARSSSELSTIEAMAAACDWAGEHENADALRAVYREMVFASVAGRGGRNKGLLGEPPENP